MPPSRGHPEREQLRRAATGDVFVLAEQVIADHRSFLLGEFVLAQEVFEGTAPVLGLREGGLVNGEENDGANCATRQGVETERGVQT